MIPRLYEADERSFDHLGLGGLPETKSCFVTEERNGQFELEMVYPMDGAKFNLLQPERIIYAPHDDSKTRQPFRIYKISRTMNGDVTIYARHISYDLSKMTVKPFSASSVAQAMAGLKTNTIGEQPFTFWTDKSTVANFKVEEPSTVRSRLGGVQGSILDVFGGGEYEWDHFTVRLRQNRGADNGVSLRFGKNLTDLVSEEDSTNVYTKAETDAAIAAATPEETDPTVPSWAKANTKPTYTASEVGAATAEDVYRIVAGTNVILVVTNYNSAVHAPAMKLQHLDPESGQYVTYWDETRRHGMTLTNAMDYTDAAAAAELSRADAAYAPRAWSGTTSGLGAEAPAGVTWISTPETVIAGGYEYEKVITTAGAVWVLTSNGLSTGATTNSYFRVAASDGTELFSIEKTDSYLVGVNATGITKSGNTVTIPVNVVAPSHPYIRATTNLVNAVWTKEDENGFTCPFASVSWSGSSGAYVATVTCSQPQAFFYFEFMQQGTAKIKNSAKTEMTGGIIFNGTTYMPTINGNKLEFVAQ